MLWSGCFFTIAYNLVGRRRWLISHQNPALEAQQTSFDDIYMRAIRGIVPPSQTLSALMRVSVVTHTEEENKTCCSTLAALPHKPSVDEQEENRRTGEIKGRMGVEVMLTGVGGGGGVMVVVVVG